jgi:hypothetical protein
MKFQSTIIAVGVFLFLGCGSNEESQNTETDREVSEEVIEELDEMADEVEDESDELIQDVDSLLEGI